MSQNADAGYGLWELAVLAVLRERAMHPYEIQRLLKQRRKDDVLVLKRGSLYHAIRRLAAGGFIAAGATTREGLRPERTTYAITPAGERTLGTWLQAVMAAPRPEPSSFMGALSFLIYLEPAEAIAALEQRLQALEEEIGRFDERLAEVSGRIGRIHVVESEYARALRAAEAKWVRDLLADLRVGRLTWDLKAILRHLRSAGTRPATARSRHAN